MGIKNWTPVDAALAEPYLEELNEVYEPLEFKAEFAEMREQDLDFYPGYKFVELVDSEVKPAVLKYFLYQPGQAIALDYTNLPVYQLNKELPVNITEENVADYIRFFFTYVRGRHGRFIIIDSHKDIQWKERPPEKAVEKLQKLITAPTIKDGDADTKLTVDAFMLFKDSLFRSDVVVEPNGMVNLENEQLVIESMPIVEDEGAETLATRAAA